MVALAEAKNRIIIIIEETGGDGGKGREQRVLNDL